MSVTEKVLAPDDPRHGSPSTYTNWKCRCDACRAAWRVKHREYTHRTGRNKPMAVFRAELATQVAEREETSHGTEGRYTRGCRCAPCRRVASEARRMRRNANPDAARAYERAYRGYSPLRSVGDADAALIRRAEEIDRLRGSATGELAELVAEQLKDDSPYSGARWQVSLDATRFDDGGTWHDFLSFGGAHLRSYETDGWTDVVAAVIDRRREIDTWAEAA